MTDNPLSSPSFAASSEKLLVPNERWNQIREIPFSMHCFTTSTEAAGLVAMNTASGF
ncbi:MAG: hypothetical protein WC879_09280 [Melioribacteraceae bacterium]